MFSNYNAPSLSDIAAVTGNNANAFDNNNGWWILIILFALCGGWGNNAYAGGRSGGAADNYVLASDFSNIERKIDSVNNGLCDGFYAMNTGMLNGFNGVTAAVSAATNALQAGQTSIGTQIQQCCCDNRAAVADLKYTMADQTNAIMQNCNANYRALHDEIVAGKLEAKDAQIAELTARVNALNLAASQQAQNNYIVNQLRPAAVPAYQVPNPYYGYGFNCQT